MKIQLTVGGKALSATLIDSETTRDFISLLPLTLTLKDHASTEKIADLPKELSTEGAPASYHPRLGDITTRRGVRDFLQGRPRLERLDQNSGRLMAMQVR